MRVIARCVIDQHFRFQHEVVDDDALMPVEDRHRADLRVWIEQGQRGNGCTVRLGWMWFQSMSSDRIRRNGTRMVAIAPGHVNR